MTISWIDFVLDPICNQNTNLSQSDLSHGSRLPLGESLNFLWAPVHVSWWSGLSCLSSAHHPICPPSASLQPHWATCFCIPLLLRTPLALICAFLSPTAPASTSLTWHYYCLSLACLSHKHENMPLRLKFQPGIDSDPIAAIFVSSGLFF